LQEELADVDLAAIRRHLDRQAALGDPRFQAMVERALNLEVPCRQRDRPRRATDQE
jgi:putative transposase